jgi:hypothetical protein
MLVVNRRSSGVLIGRSTYRISAHTPTPYAAPSISAPGGLRSIRIRATNTTPMITELITKESSSLRASS